MSLTISGTLFTGPFKLDKTMIRANQHPCVYVVVSKEGSSWDPQFRLIHVGESGDAGIDFSADPRSAEWLRAGAEISVYLRAVPRADDPSGERRRDLTRKIARDHARHDLVRRGAGGR